MGSADAGAAEMRAATAAAAEVYTAAAKGSRRAATA